MFEDKIIRDLSQKEYSYNQFLKEILTYTSKNFNCYIGTDSQVLGKKISIVTCVCFHKSSDGGGSKIFYIKEKVGIKKYPTLRSKMLLEVYRSIETAIELEPYIKNKLTIHLDIGSSNKSDTSVYCQELQFLVKSQGYSCKIKPDSWASSSVADRMTKS